MPFVDLEELVYDDQVAALISGFSDVLSDASSIPVCITNLAKECLFGQSDPSASKFPVKVAEKVIGWVAGGDKAALLADLLSHLATKESEIEALADETLEKYTEIALLYDIAAKISTCLDMQEIAALVIYETHRRIKSDNVSVMLLDKDTGNLEIVDAVGEEYTLKTSMEAGQGIAGHILVSGGKAEIINNVSADPRYVPGADKVCAMMCAPLSIKEGAIGVANISRHEPVDFTAGDLKLFSAIISQAASAIENTILHENKLKQAKIKSNLERYIAPQLVQAIVDAKEDVSFAPASRAVTILFSDIRNFSTTCEKLPPETIVNYLNEYFTLMSEIVFQHDGTLNKYVGDMIMAFFGAPTALANDARQAVEAAIEMQQCLQSMSVAWIRDNFHTGIGINTGVVVVGNVGSPTHTDYTTIGDEVNVAERLESIAKGGQILISRNTYNITKNYFDFKAYGKVPVKGRREPVEIFEVVY